VTIDTGPIKTSISCIRGLNNLWVLISDCAWISYIFSSLSTFLLYCFFHPQTELVILHFGKLLYIQLCRNSFMHIFMKISNTFSVHFFSCEWFSCDNLLLGHIPHCNSDEFTLKIWSSEEADLSHATILITFTFVHCTDASSTYQEVAVFEYTKLYVLYTVLLTLITLLLLWICKIYRYGVKKIVLSLHSIKAIVWCDVRAW
jgi:hypothetical protein